MGPSSLDLLKFGHRTKETHCHWLWEVSKSILNLPRSISLAVSWLGQDPTVTILMPLASWALPDSGLACYTIDIWAKMRGRIRLQSKGPCSELHPQPLDTAPCVVELGLQNSEELWKESPMKHEELQLDKKPQGSFNAGLWYRVANSSRCAGGRGTSRCP